MLALLSLVIFTSIFYLFLVSISLSTLQQTSPDTDTDQYHEGPPEGGRGSYRDRDRDNYRDEQKAFTLLLRKSTDIVIPPKGMQQIGVSFVPERLGEYSASVQIRSGTYLSQLFPGISVYFPSFILHCLHSFFILFSSERFYKLYFSLKVSASLSPFSPIHTLYARTHDPLFSLSLSLSLSGVR